MDVIFLIGGIALLYLGGNFLVKGSVSLANHFKVSPFVIGIVIISLGTSFPELIVSVEAAIKNHPDISLGNVVGSNIANIALALGITALILPIIVRKKSIWIDWLVLFGVSVIIIFCGFVFGELSWFCGLILLILLIAYYFYLIVDARKNRKKIKIEKAKYSIIVSIIIITLSFVALAVGAKGVIEGGSNIAKTMGISERVISLTVIAFGTSLPEIATSFVAALKKQLDISIAHVLGSNIFNVAGVLGITTVVTPRHPIPVNDRFLFSDFWWMMGFTVLLITMIYFNKMMKISRFEGAILIIIYLIYVFFLF